MIQKTNIGPVCQHFLRQCAQWLQVYRRPILAAVLVFAALPLLAMLIAGQAIGAYRASVLSPQAAAGKHIAVGMVLGAGVTSDGKPYKELRSRLDTAAASLQQGVVQKLILSGDNRFRNYDEPTAMKNYLMQTYHIPASQLQPDFAGRSTYESCQRASQVFGQTRLVLFSAGSHLPRAIFLCNHFGIETYGVASTLEANNATRREAVAGVKALYNVYVHGENTILGTPVKM